MLDPLPCGRVVAAPPPAPGGPDHPVLGALLIPDNSSSSVCQPIGVIGPMTLIRFSLVTCQLKHQCNLLGKQEDNIHVSKFKPKSYVVSFKKKHFYEILSLPL